MKKFYPFLFIFIAINCFSQERNLEETNVKEEKVKMYFGIGLNGQIHDDFNLNQYLFFSNAPEIDVARPELTLALNFFGKKFSSSTELGFMFSESEKGNIGNKTTSSTGRISFHYNLLNKQKIAFTTGLNISGTSTQLNLFTKNNIVDLNNLDPSSNSGLIVLRNQTFYTGPSVSLYMFQHKNTKLKLNFGYEFAFTRGKWKSDFSKILNGVNESGNNRFIFGLIIL